MRGIEVRGWSRADNIMVYNLNSPRLKHGVLDDDDYILMQYIDRKDKDGRKIYERDIVKLIDYHLPEDYEDKLNEHIFGVLWQDCGWWLINENGALSLGEMDHIAFLCFEIEIIGNQYEDEEKFMFSYHAKRFKIRIEI